MASGMQKYQSRSAREAKAYRALQLGAVTGAGFVVTTVLWVVGAMGDHPSIVLLVLTVILAARFASVTGLRNKR